MEGAAEARISTLISQSYAQGNADRPVNDDQYRESPDQKLDNRV
jgi:hypothetical protein